MVESISLATVTTTPAVGSAVDVNFGAAIGDVTSAADLDSLTFTGYLSAYPSSGFAGVVASATAAGTDGELAGVTAAVGAQANTADTAAGSTYTVELTDVSALSDNSPTTEGNITASATQGAGKFSFTPTVAGTHTLTVWSDTDADGVIDIGEAVQAITITVAAASAFSTGTSSAYIIDGNGTDVGTVTTNALGASGSKTMSTANVAAITVSLKDAANVAMTTGNTITATIAGAGGIGASTANAPVASQCSASTVVRSVTLAADAVNTVYVCADGTAGVGTVTISVTNAAGVTAVLATRTVTFYGAVAKLAISEQPMSVLRAGGYQSGAIAALDGLTPATTPAVVIKATDSAGNIVEGLSISAVPSSTSVIASSSVTEGVVGVDADAIYGGNGYYVAHVTSATSAASGDSATVTYRILNPADATGLTYLTAVATFTVGGTVSTETLKTDKASYAPGEAMVITLTGTDAAGNPVYDGAASPAITGNKAFGGTLPIASFYIGGKMATSSTKPTVYAPSIAGDFILTATSGNTAKTVLTATGSVVSDSADAVAEATDAANAATDAALAASDAADAATAAAEDASAAVAKLAKSVNKQLKALKAQLTSLIALVNKLR
jgi:hypothetical protein